MTTQEPQEKLYEFIKPTYSAIKIKVEDTAENIRQLYFTDEKFGVLYPKQRYHYLKNLIPIDFYKQNLLDAEWFELTPNENPDALVSDYIVTLRYLDNVKTTYDKLTRQFKLRLSFDSDGANEISESASKNHNEYFGLLLNNKLVSIGSIDSLINNNRINLVLNCTLSQLEFIKQEIREQANYLRLLRRATKRGKPKN